MCVCPAQTIAKSYMVFLRGCLRNGCTPAQVKDDLLQLSACWRVDVCSGWGGLNLAVHALLYAWPQRDACFASPRTG